MILEAYFKSAKKLTVVLFLFFYYLSLPWLSLLADVASDSLPAVTLRMHCSALETKCEELKIELDVLKASALLGDVDLTTIRLLRELRSFWNANAFNRNQITQTNPTFGLISPSNSLDFLDMTVEAILEPESVVVLSGPSLDMLGDSELLSVHNLNVHCKLVDRREHCVAVRFSRFDDLKKTLSVGERISVGRR